MTNEQRGLVECDGCKTLHKRDRLFLVCLGCRNRAAWKKPMRRMPFRRLMGQTLLAAIIAILGMVMLAVH